MVKALPGVDGCLSMREINAMGANISAAKKLFETYETTDQRLPPAAGIAASATGACLYAMVQGVRILEPHSASAVVLKVDEKLVPLHDIMLE